MHMRRITSACGPRLFRQLAICLAAAMMLLQFGSRPAQAASDCVRLIPPDGLYDIFRSWESQDFQLAIDQYVYEKEYQTHEEARNDGFSLGTIIYGVPLESTGTFTSSQRNAWKRSYEQRQKLQMVVNSKQAFESLVLNTRAIEEVSRCIIATTGIGLISTVDPIDDCTFRFSVSYRMARVGDSPVAKINGKMTVAGGSCDAWPNADGIIQPGPLSIFCRRYGRGGVSVLIPTDAGSASGTVEPMADPGPEPSQPVMQTNYTHVPGERRFQKNESYNGRGRGYGHELWISFNLPGNVHFASYRCEGEGCGWVYEGNQPTVNGTNITWSAWSNTGAPALLIFNFVYLVPNTICVLNCDYADRKAAWDAARAKTCAAAQPGPVPNGGFVPFNVAPGTAVIKQSNILMPWERAAVAAEAARGPAPN